MLKSPRCGRSGSSLGLCWSNVEERVLNFTFRTALTGTSENPQIFGVCFYGTIIGGVPRFSSPAGAAVEAGVVFQFVELQVTECCNQRDTAKEQDFAEIE